MNIYMCVCLGCVYVLQCDALHLWLRRFKYMGMRLLRVLIDVIVLVSNMLGKSMTRLRSYAPNC